MTSSFVVVLDNEDLSPIQFEYVLFFMPRHFMFRWCVSGLFAHFVDVAALPIWHRHHHPVFPFKKCAHLDAFAMRFLRACERPGSTETRCEIPSCRWSLSWGINHFYFEMQFFSHVNMIRFFVHFFFFFSLLRETPIIHLLKMIKMNDMKNNPILWKWKTACKNQCVEID